MILGSTFFVRNRATTLAVLLAAGTLALPKAGYGQTTEGERALLNKNDVPFGISDQAASPMFDGERALLGRRAPSVLPVIPSGVDLRPALGSQHRIDGERALLGKSLPPRSR
jgi:hypothetical protein